jgi:hypothetical protein
MKKKNIMLAAPLLARYFIDFEESVLNIPNKKYKILLNKNKHRLGLLSKYLDCKLHDSWVLKIKKTKNNYSIFLNDFSTHVFADALIERKGLKIDHDKLVFPLLIEFIGNLEVAHYTVSFPKGTLHETNTLKMGEYLYEQVISIDKDKFEFAFVFSSKKYRSPNILLFLTSQEILITEKQDEAWQQIFGSKFDNYYQYYK